MDNKEQVQNKFWEWVEQMNWGTDFDHQKHQNQSVMQFSYEDMDKMHDVYREYRSLLAAEIDTEIRRLRAENKENESGFPYSGDDSFGDMIAHVVGMGKDYYERALKDLDLVRKIVPEESFDYCFPFKDTFEQLKPQHYEERATKALENLERKIKNLQDNGKARVVWTEHVLALKEQLEGIRDGKFKDEWMFDTADWMIRDKNDESRVRRQQTWYNQLAEIRFDGRKDYEGANVIKSFIDWERAKADFKNRIENGLEQKEETENKSKQRKSLKI